MRPGLRESKGKQVLLCAAVCAVLAACAIIPFIIRGGGTFTLREDFNTQNIPFGIAENRAIHAGSTWVWNLDLGSSLIQGFSYYHLGSPFFWFTLLFPAEAYPYLTGWMFILKYAAAGATSFLYFRRYVRDWRTACIGAVLYAFSGFMTANLFFYFFHDIVAFFPILLLGLDRAVQEKKYGLFIIGVFMNCLLNYVFFFQETIFLVIYFIVMYHGRDIRKFFGTALRILGCGIFGGCMAAPLFLPSLLYVFGNPRSGEKTFHLFYSLPRLLLILKGFFLPADPLHDNSVGILGAWDSAACWLPVIGGGLVIAYILKKRDRLSALIVTLIVISLFPVLNAAFMFYNEDIYMRWWFMLILLMILASLRVMEEPGEYPVAGAAVFYSALVAVFTGLAFVLPAGKDGETVVFHGGRLVLYAAVSVCGALSVIFFGKWAQKAGKKKAGIVFSVLLAAVCVVTTATTIRLYLRDAGTEEYLGDLARGESLEVIDEQYRYRESANVYTLTGRGAGLSAFCSTVSNSVVELDDLFDYEKELHITKRMNKASYPGLAELLGGRFVLTEDGGIEEAEACPIGFCAGAVITKEELLALPVEERGMALLSAVLLPEDAEGVPADLQSLLDGLPRITAAQLHASIESEGTDPLVHDLVTEHTSQAVSAFHRDGRGFSCDTGFSDAQAVWFSVPWESGWRAWIDGESVRPVKSAGMMLIAVPAGAHHIVFEYQTPGFIAGIILSICCFLIFGGVMLYRKGIFRRCASAG